MAPENTQNSIPAIDPSINIHRVAVPNDLTSQLNGILSADDTQDVEFNYINSIGNWNIINDMNAQRREERMAKDKEIDSRISQITSSHIETEVKRIFAHIEKTTGKKRSRTSKSDKEDAYQNIIKRIRLEVSNEFDLRFLQNNCDSAQFQEVFANQVNTPDLVDALSSARLI